MVQQRPCPTLPFLYQKKNNNNSNNSFHSMTRKEKKEEKRAQKRKERAEAMAAKQAAEEASGGIPGRLQEHLERVDGIAVRIKPGFVRGMRTEGLVYANDNLLELLFEELGQTDGSSGFIPALRQVANVASLPGIVGKSFGMPDIHSGYGFAIGNVAAMDMDNPEAVVSPGGVGFDINCGVRLIRTNLKESEIDASTRERLCQRLFEAIPVGVGTDGALGTRERDLEAILDTGMKFLVDHGYAWPEDLMFVEENGNIAGARSGAVSNRAKKRGISQVGSLGSGNHYVEVQVVDEIFDEKAAAVMGLNEVGKIVVMVHCGSRGLGHQVCTDALQEMDRMCKDLNDRQLACCPISSASGQRYLASMRAAANYAFANRGIITHCIRGVFSQIFRKSPEDLDMHLIYDVCHNIAKEEIHTVNGETKRVLVHRKGATRAFPPHHPEIPAKYQEIGQPVIIGGSMGTCSYVLTGTETGMQASFGSTCHGAGRSLSRSAALRYQDSRSVLSAMQEKGISIRISTPKLVAEEAAEAYKDVTQVVETCAAAGISKLCVRLRPIAVIKG